FPPLRKGGKNENCIALVSSERPLVQALTAGPDVFPLRQRASHDVERLNLGCGGWTGVILVGQQCPYHGVTRLPVGGADPVAERRLVAEAKFARHRGAPHIVGVTVDLNAGYPVDEEGDFRERRRDLRGETLIYVVLVYPIPDFACPGTRTRMQRSAS